MTDLVLPSSLAAYDPLGMLGPDIGPPSMTGHDGIIVHTMAGSFVGTDAFFHDGGWTGTESHVGIAGSGFCKQWVPWNRKADANLDGNPRYLSIEDADIGESFPPASTASDESPPLTDAQVFKIIDLCVFWCDVRNHQQCPSTWTCHQKGIPPVWMGTSCDRGIGVHRHGIDPWRTQWGGADCPKFSLTDGKICPRSVRLRQVRDRIVPAVQARLSLGGFLADLTDAEQHEVLTKVRDIYAETASDSLECRLREVTATSRILRGQLNSILARMPQRVVKEGFVIGDPVYVSDLASYIYQVEQNGPFDSFVQQLRVAAGLEPNALRVDQSVITDMLLSLPSKRD